MTRHHDVAAERRVIAELRARLDAGEEYDEHGDPLEGRLQTHEDDLRCLTTPSPARARSWPDAAALLESLTGLDIVTVSGSVNKILSTDGTTAMVGTSRSPGGRPVDVGDVQRGLDKLREHGQVAVNVTELGHRSAFVGAVLATLPFAQFTKHPATVVIIG